jgi:selT/selW/selH-like putative selenoprotein
LREAFDAEVELIESRGGVFEVVVDGELVFSKQATGHFPNVERLLEDLGKG